MFNKMCFEKDKNEESPDKVTEETRPETTGNSQFRRTEVAMASDFNQTLQTPIRSCEIFKA